MWPSVILGARFVFDREYIYKRFSFYLYSARTNPFPLAHRWSPLPSSPLSTLTVPIHPTLQDFMEVDEDYIKLYRLGQYTIEYLLHCQEYLSHGTVELETKLREAIRVSGLITFLQHYLATLISINTF